MGIYLEKRSVLMPNDMILYFTDFTSNKPNEPILLRNLNKCDIFTIRLSKLKKHHYALVEWGRAKEMGKVLVVVMDETSSEFPQKFLSYLAKESKESFKKHSKEMRNCIIKKNEALSVNSYSEYKKTFTEFIAK